MEVGRRAVTTRKATAGSAAPRPRANRSKMARAPVVTSDAVDGHSTSGAIAPSDPHPVVHPDVYRSGPPGRRQGGRRPLYTGRRPAAVDGSRPGESNDPRPLPRSDPPRSKRRVGSADRANRPNRHRGSASSGWTTGRCAPRHAVPLIAPGSRPQQMRRWLRRRKSLGAGTRDRR